MTTGRRHVSMGEIEFVVTRAASATIWTLACAAPWLLLAPLQLSLVVVSRINASHAPYLPLKPSSEAESETEDVEAPHVDPLLEQQRLLGAGQACAAPELRFAPLAFREVSAKGVAADPKIAANPDTMSPGRLQQIVNSLEN